MLPHSSDEGAKVRLRATCCAFANGGGGFLVFGIHDDRSRTREDRIVGLDHALDFPARFGEYPKSCSPSVHWTFLNPPLVLNSGAILHVVQIQQSWKAPHGVGTSDQGWRFMKRGNEGMSMEEIRSTFLGFYEKRLRLQLLEAELATVQEVAKGAFVAEAERMDSHTAWSRSRCRTSSLSLLTRTP